MLGMGYKPARSALKTAGHNSYSDGPSRVSTDIFVCPRCIGANGENPRSSEHRKGLCGKADAIPQQGDTYDDDTFAGPNGRSEWKSVRTAKCTLRSRTNAARG